VQIRKWRLFLYGFMALRKVNNKWTRDSIIIVVKSSKTSRGDELNRVHLYKISLQHHFATKIHQNRPDLQTSFPGRERTLGTRLPDLMQTVTPQAHSVLSWKNGLIMTAMKAPNTSAEGKCSFGERFWMIIKYTFCLEIICSTILITICHWRS